MVSEKVYKLYINLFILFIIYFHISPNTRNKERLQNKFIPDEIAS
jgi:hypothetical protein